MIVLVGASKCGIFRSVQQVWAHRASVACRMWGGGRACTDPMSDLGQVGRGGDQAGRCAIPTPRTNALVPSGLPSGAATMASPRISTCPSCQGLELRTCSEWTRLQNLNQRRAYLYIERLARRTTHAGGVCIGKCTFGTGRLKASACWLHLAFARD